MWWVGTRKGLFFIVDGKVARTGFLGVPVTMVLARGSHVIAAVEHGHFGPKLHESHDGGVTFAEIDSPVFPEGAEASVKTVWALEPDGDDGLWCGTIPGGLFRRVNGAWSLVKPLWEHPLRQEWSGGGADEPGIHSICVNPTDSRDVIVGVSVGGVWHTADGGESFRVGGEGLAARYMPPEQQNNPASQDPHLIVRSRSDPTVLWCQHHSGVWRSIDAGASWQEVAVPPSSFGFAVAVHPTRPERAWFVPADSDASRIPLAGAVVVARTDDGGASFTVQRQGLPQEHAYDLVFRHALAIDATGDRLCFGSTTGSLWETGDGGQQWVQRFAHLPPIYVVRPGEPTELGASATG